MIHISIHIDLNRDKLISQVLSEINRGGYTLKFRREPNCLYCPERDAWFMPEEFEVDEAFYFQAVSNPDADRILYAITLWQSIKGFLIDTCTVYTDNVSPEMMVKLKAEEKQIFRDLSNLPSEKTIKQLILIN